MRSLIPALCVISLTAQLGLAQDSVLRLTPKPFKAESQQVQAPSPAKRALEDSVPLKPGLSKKAKWTLVLVGAGAVAAGVLLVRNGALSGGSNAGARPAGPLNSTVVINGVTQ